MSEEERSKQGAEAPNIIKQYEQMLLNDENWYFDLDQFETIIEHYFEENDYATALEALVYAKTIFESSVELLLLEAQINIATGQLTKSILHLKKVLSIQPTNDDAHVMIASLYSQLRQSEKAISHLEKALQYCDDFMKDELYMDLALEYENIEEYNNSIEVLIQALNVNSDNEAASYELAYCFEEAGKVDEAIEFFNEFIDEHPYSFPTWYNLGNMYLKKKEYDKAITAFDFCVTIQEDFTPALINIATAYTLVGAYERAIDSLEDAIRLEGENEELLSFVGECYEKLEQPEEALEYFEMALILNPESTEAMTGISIALVDLERYNEATPPLEIHYKKNPNNIELGLLLADIYARNELTEKAEDLYLDILSKFPKEVKVRHTFFDFLFLYQSNSYLALEEVENSLFIFPDDGDLLQRKMISLFVVGRRREALEILTILVMDGQFDKENAKELYPEMLNDPDVISMINS